MDLDCNAAIKEGAYVSRNLARVTFIAQMPLLPHHQSTEILFGVSAVLAVPRTSRMRSINQYEIQLSPDGQQLCLTGRLGAACLSPKRR